MTLRHYIAILLFGTAIAASAWGLILYFVDPRTAQAPVFVLFYLTLFIWLTGFFSSVATWIRSKRYPKEAIDHVILISLRQAILFSSLVVVALLLASFDALNLFTLLLTIFVVTIVEFSLLKVAERRYLASHQS